MQTAYQLYGIILPTPDELESSPGDSGSNPHSLEVIADYNPPRHIRDTDEAGELLEKKEALLQELKGLAGRVE